MNNETINPEIATGIKVGDLKVEFPGGFKGTTATVSAVTEAGQKLLGFAVDSITLRKSAMVGVTLRKSAMVGVEGV